MDSVHDSFPIQNREIAANRLSGNIEAFRKFGDIDTAFDGGQ
ncbi:hypothetical protein GCM10009604_05100 [Corynebacterium aurimucosum]